MAHLSRRLDPDRCGQDTQFLENGLKKLVIGQDEAIAPILNIFQMFQVGMAAPGRPIGSFLFLGPTGTGKTRIVEGLGQVLLGDARSVIKIDCAEFQHSHEIAKLIGSPPGYLGHRETHPLLSQEVLNQFHTEKLKLSFVLFDEIEKASDALWNLLLGILDKATLTLGDNRRVDFSRTMIFMTSNLGAAKMVGKPPMGFAGAFKEELIELKAKQLANIAKIGMDAARSRFSPEFLNRIDKVVSFKPLSMGAIRQILDVELAFVKERIYRTGVLFSFDCTEEAKRYLVSEGFSTEYGARHLKRAIERNLVQPMSNLIATKQVRSGDVVRVDLADSGDRLEFISDDLYQPPTLPAIQAIAASVPEAAPVPPPAPPAPAVPPSSPAPPAPPAPPVAPGNRSSRLCFWR